MPQIHPFLSSLLWSTLLILQMLVLLLLAVLLFIVNLFNSIIDLSKNLVRAFVTAIISSYTWQFSNSPSTLYLVQTSTSSKFVVNLYYTNARVGNTHYAVMIVWCESTLGETLYSHIKTLQTHSLLLNEPVTLAALL